MEEAKTIAAELLRLKPDYSAKWVSAQEPYKSPADLDHRLMASAKRAYQSDGRLLPDLALSRSHDPLPGRLLSINNPMTLSRH